MRGRTKEKSEGLKGKNDSKVFMFSRGGVCLFLRENQITARIAKINNEQSTYWKYNKLSVIESERSLK